MGLEVVNLPGLTSIGINELNKLYLALIEEVAERAFARLRMTEQYTAEGVVATGHPAKILKYVGLVIDDGVVAKDFFIKLNRPVHVAYTHDSTIYTADS